MPSTCRWGILGTANIARKNWKAIRVAGNSTLTAVASRDAAKAKKFIDECQSEVAFTPAPAACGSYEELLKRADVDAVYIPLPTGIRREWVIKAAEAGKHILCEKPCGTNAADLRAMLDACKTKKVQFMDGVMFMHSARLPLLRKVIDDGESVGTLRRVASQFCFQAGDDFMKSNIRVSNDLEPLGALGDLGWYNLRFALWVMKYQMPERVSGRTLFEHGSGAKPVPIEFSGELFFPGGVSASFYCSFRTENQQWAHISWNKRLNTRSGFRAALLWSRSRVRSEPAVLPRRGLHVQHGKPSEALRGPRVQRGRTGAQEVNMIRTFSDIATSGKLDPTWGDIAMKTQLVLDACLQSAREGGKLVSVE